jgi:geranylgeranylglycerol-phosphate geranylgeranyltransferase
MNKQLIGKIITVIRLLRPEISLLGILCVYIGVIVSESYYFSLDVLTGMLAVFFAGAGSMPFNDYFDYEIDKINHPNRPIPSGLIKPIYAFYIGIIFFFISLVLSYLINIICFLIALFGIILICSYELIFKNKILIGNIVVALTTALSFTYGGAIFAEYIKPIFFTVITFFAFLGREILMDVRDSKGDRYDRITLPLKIGEKSAIYLACLIILISLILLFLPPFINIFSIWYLLFAIPIAIITIYAISLSLKNVNNSGKTTDILRISMLQGLILFMIAIFI